MEVALDGTGPGSHPDRFLIHPLSDAREGFTCPDVCLPLPRRGLQEERPLAHTDTCRPMLVSVVVDMKACSPTSPLHFDHTPEAMTRRARWYLSVAGLRQGSLGLFCIIAPWLFTSAAFIPILSYLPVVWWGTFMTICGILCGLAALLRSGDMARVAMVLSATITLVLAAGVWIGIGIIWVGFWQGERDVAASPLMPILLSALAAKDFIVCAQPVRSPFEVVVRQVMGE